MEATEAKYKTTCCYCGVGCGMLVTKDRTGKLSVEGDPAHPVNKGMLCSKGMNLHYTAMETTDRLLFPQFRTRLTEKFQRVSWEEAMRQAAGRFRDIIETHGPDAVGFYISGQCLTEEYYLANKLVKGFIGTNNIDTNSRLCMSSAVSAYKLALGEDSVPGCYEDIELASTFLIAGANPAWCHPILYRRIEAHKATNEHIKIIVVDPRRTQTAAAADLHLQIRPGTDIVLFHAIARGLIENGFIDETFIGDHTTGFEALKAKVMQRSLQEAAAICDIRFTDIYRAVKYIGLSGGFISMWAMGLNQSIAGVNKNLALINLSLITGKIGRPGSGPFSLTGQTNAMGGREVGGMATLASAHRDLGNPVHRREIAGHWKVADIPARPGLTATEMFSALKEGRLKALWIVCTNPLVSLPDSGEAEEALRQAEFVVVQDMSGKADTLSFAHLALPAATWLEKEGTVTNSERRISHLEKVIDPPGEALPDAEILSRFAAAMGWEAAFAHPGPGEIYREHAGLTRGTRIDIAALDYPALKAAGTVQWPISPDSGQGTQRLFTDHRFYHPDGRAKIHAVPEENHTESLSADYPFILTTGRIRDQWHTMTRSGKVNKLRQHIPRPVLEIHPRDAASRSIAEGDPVVIRSRRGEVQVTAHLTDELKRGTVFLPMHWGRLAGRSFARTNNLTAPAVDPVSKQPGYKYAAVEVARYHRPPQRIVIAGESNAIPFFIKRLRGLGVTDPIHWICADSEDFFYDQAECIACLRDGDSGLPRFDPQALVEGLEVTVLGSRRPSLLDRKAKTVTDNRHEVHRYDQLILAPVAHGAYPPASTADGLVHYRDKRRILRLMKTLHRGDSLLLTGEDPVAIEAALALSERNLKVSIHFERKPYLKDILDENAAALLEDILSEAGVSLTGGEKIASVCESGGGQQVTFESGRHLSCAAVISFDGRYPRTGFLESAGLQTGGTIPVNEFLQTEDPSVFALGEGTSCAGSPVTGRTATEKQALCLASYFQGDLARYYEHSLPELAWNIGEGEKPRRIWVMGDIRTDGAGDTDEVFFLDRKKRVYKKCSIRGDRLAGAIFIGEPGEEAYYRQLIEEGTELGELRDKLLRPGTATEGGTGAARIICSCMQVDENTIAAAIAAGCKTVAEIGSRLGAGTRCGSCKPELAGILKNKTTV